MGIRLLQGHLDIDGTLAINGILVEIRGDNVQLGEGVHITTAISTAQALLDVGLLLLEISTSANWATGGGGFGCIGADLIDENGLDGVHLLGRGKSQAAGGDSEHSLLDNRNRTQKWDESPC